MSKKKMYRMLLFILFTFIFVGILIHTEFSENSRWANKQKESMNYEDQAIVEDQTIGQEQTTKEAQSTDDIDTSTSENLIDSTEIEAVLDGETSQEDNTAPSLQEPGDTVMVFSGDIYMSNYILNKHSKDGINGILSKSLLEEFEQADIAMVNQEFAFSSAGTPMEDKQYTFRVDPRWVQILDDMQVDIVTLANNHSLDYGVEALLDTFNTLDVANIQYVGAGNDLAEARKTKYFEVNDKMIAILGASRVIPATDWNASNDKPGLFTTYDPNALIAEIKIAKELSDYVVVYVHWGIEKSTSPEEYQRTLAKQYIDAGADLVVGSHPHVLQGIEYYKDKPIIYSLGNFMFYNTINQTAVLKVTLKEDEEIQVQFLPCKTENALTNRIDNQNERAEFYRYMTDISFDVNFDENGFVLH